jgi:hypothetical protein
MGVNVGNCRGLNAQPSEGLFLKPLPPPFAWQLQTYHRVDKKWSELKIVTLYVIVKYFFERRQPER